MTQFKVGDKVKVCDGYNFVPAQILSIGPKKIKVKMEAHGFFTEAVKRFLPTQMALLTETCVVVSVQNKRSRSGQFYVEKVKYPEFHLPAKYIPTQLYIQELDGVLICSLKDYLNKAQHLNQVSRDLKKILEAKIGYKII